MVLKNKKQHKICEGEDKISKLEDAQIHHILSFVPTKCALSTCILSKRWKYVSKSISTLDFRGWEGRYDTRDELILKTKQFMNFLDTVLYLPERPKIKKFCLSWCKPFHFDECRLSKWIGIVIERKVEELLFQLEGVANPSFIFPASFYTCDSLAVLELYGVILKVPNTVSFPNLKLLRLSFVSGIWIEKLFSNCPILEELSLTVYSCSSSEVICISNLALKKLDIASCSFQEFALKICAPNLLSFSYRGEPPKDFVIDSFPALVEAYIFLYDTKEYQAKTMIKLFEKFSNLKILKMSGRSFTVLHEADILLTGFPTLNNLIHLRLGSLFVCQRFVSDSVSTVRILIRFLQFLPYIESIVFDQVISWKFGKDDDSWSVDPKCSLLHLKSIKFKNFDGKQFELDAIKFFLKYAGVLETVIIEPSPFLSGNYEAENRAMRQLLMFQKPINCIIKFVE